METKKSKRKITRKDKAIIFAYSVRIIKEK